MTKEKKMDYQKIYAEALTAAHIAEHEFVAKYGELAYCGFAWVEIADGRSPFVNWLRKNNIGKKHWRKGWCIWNPTGNGTQSMDVKEHGSEAFTKVLVSHGIDAWACSRAD